MEAVVALSNLAENPATHAKAFAGDEGAAAFTLFVELLRHYPISSGSSNSGGASGSSSSGISSSSAARSAARSTTTATREDAPELQREGFRALSCLALARAGNVGGDAGANAAGAVPDELLLLLLEKVRYLRMAVLTMTVLIMAVLTMAVLTMAVLPLLTSVLLAY